MTLRSFDPCLEGKRLGFADFEYPDGKSDQKIPIIVVRGQVRAERAPARISRKYAYWWMIAAHNAIQRCVAMNKICPFLYRGLSPSLVLGAPR